MTNDEGMTKHKWSSLARARNRSPGRRTDQRHQENAEHRTSNVECRRQKSEVRGQRTEVRRKRSRPGEQM